MRYAIVSDIHANWQAWSAVRDDIRKRGVDTMVCLGDIVGYGPSPSRVYSDLLANCDNYVLGNHDAAAAGKLGSAVFNENARRSTAWTASQFDQATLKQLGSAPMLMEDDDAVFVHAETPAPDEFGYVETIDDARACFEATDKRFIFIGHTHLPTIFALAPDGMITETGEQVMKAQSGMRYLVNVGSVGDPGDGSVQASYCIFDTRAGEISLRKVDFDIAAFRAELERVPELSLPWFLKQHEGEAVRPAYDQAVAAGKVAGTKIRVQPSRAKIRVKASALSTHAGDTLRIKTEAVKAAAKPARKSRTGLIVSLIGLAAFAVMGGIYILYSSQKPSIGTHAVSSISGTAPASGSSDAPPVKHGRLVVISATYGVPGDAQRTRDVRVKLQAIIDRGATQFMVSELAQGDDPARNVAKTLLAEFAAGNQRFTLKGTDSQTLNLEGHTVATPVHAVSAIGDSLGRIPEAKDYKLIYDLDLAKLGVTVQYAVDNTASAPRFDRVAYLIELKKANEPEHFLWVSMDAFTTEASKLGVPTVASGIFFQQSVANITVVSDVGDIQTGERIGSGNLEFWSNNYAPHNTANVPGADSATYDFGDSTNGPPGGHGSMQVHNTAAKQTLFAINCWRNGTKADIGIGNSNIKQRRRVPSLDWTFSGNGESYSTKRLRVFVHPAP